MTDMALKPDRNNMPDMPELAFPPCRFRISDSGGDGPARIWDPLRGCWLALTPEEWVRQHLIQFLATHHGVPPQLISQEHPVRIQGMPQRADVVVFGRDREPLLLAECKAPSVAVDASVYAQGVRYNAVLDARYMLITNGLKHYIYEKDKDGNYSALESFPPLDI